MDISYTLNEKIWILIIVIAAIISLLVILVLFTAIGGIGVYFVFCEVGKCRFEYTIHIVDMTPPVLSDFAYATDRFGNDITEQIEILNARISILKTRKNSK